MLSSRISFKGTALTSFISKTNSPSYVSIVTLFFDHPPSEIFISAISEYNSFSPVLSMTTPSCNNIKSVPTHLLSSQILIHTFCCSKIICFSLWFRSSRRFIESREPSNSSISSAVISSSLILRFLAVMNFKNSLFGEPIGLNKSCSSSRSMFLL